MTAPVVKGHAYGNDFLLVPLDALSLLGRVKAAPTMIEFYRGWTRTMYPY